MDGTVEKYCFLAGMEMSISTIGSSLLATSTPKDPEVGKLTRSNYMQGISDDLIEECVRES